MPFLFPKQQRQRTEGLRTFDKNANYSECCELKQDSGFNVSLLSRLQNCYSNTDTLFGQTLCQQSHFSDDSWEIT